MIFNILTISPVAIGIGGRKKNVLTLKSPRKSNFIIFQDWNFTLFGGPLQPNFTPFWGPRQPNFTPFGGPQQLFIKHILPARPGPTRAVVGDPPMEWNFGFRDLETEWYFNPEKFKLDCDINIGWLLHVCPVFAPGPDVSVPHVPPPSSPFSWLEPYMLLILYLYLCQVCSWCLVLTHY